ncbi:lauroyl acyltransferase [Paracoccus sp. PARArs4]|uniref:lysophospholipid acyltransferase family protein n=1 Tax=Paracoccus sp. PARArs4 TaxID=2853442 RepID=UPI0024A7945A|nr:lauroyl acyltransferase [Paracoccus sp. PARArs4]
MREDGTTLIDRLANRAFLLVVGATRLLPYERRIPMTGWIFSRVIAPLAGWRRRIRDNLALARPDLSETEVEQIVRAVPDNAGRAIAEIYSGDEFTSRIHADDPLEGPGLPMLEEAFESGRPVIIACAHFGNYDAMRGALSGRGYPVGALYRPMNNEAFNRHYIPAITAISEPLFPRGRAGLSAMLRFLRGGGWLALGFDQHDRHSPELRFFDLPSKTVLTPAELAVRYDALLLPVHAIRKEDGLGFRVHVGDPVPHGDAKDMMQALNDDLEQLVRRHMGQWFWVHRRWK